MSEEKKENIQNTKQRNSKILIGAIIFLSFLFGWAFGHLDTQKQLPGFSPTAITDSNNKRPNFDLFWQVWDKVTTEYDGNVDFSKLINGAIDGMVKATGDPYTNYFTQEQTQQFEDDLNGTISGIGAEVGIKDDRVVIVAPLDESPAKKAGLKAQDLILKIDDTDTKGLDLTSAVLKIRGQEGTKVKLVIQRGTETLNFEITREKVQIKSVKSEVKANNIGYIEINQFNSNTGSQLRAAEDELISKNVKGIIIDLRNNPGGYLDQAIEVGSEFIKSGTIVTEKKDKDNSKKEDYQATGKGKFTDPNIPIVVLVNGGSASAAEIVSGALQDHKRATLIGEKTFGKGSVQSVENVGGGATLHVTIAHWYTPNGRGINKQGLTPDIEVKMTDEDVKAGRDPQLDRAISELNK